MLHSPAGRRPDAGRVELTRECTDSLLGEWSLQGNAPTLCWESGWEVTLDMYSQLLNVWTTFPCPLQAVGRCVGVGADIHVFNMLI